jgi:sugar lactone lactonase YvrE
MTCNIAAIAIAIPLNAQSPASVPHESDSSTVVHSRVVATLPDSTFWPEGVDYDPRSGHYYVASVRHGTIAERRPDGSVRELWPRGQRGIGAMLGVRVDTARGVLWATTTSLPQLEGFKTGDPPIAALLRIRIADGKIERRWDVAPAPRGHVLGDLAVAPNGDVWMTDSYEPVAYRLPASGDTLERITSPLFRSLQGVAPARDGRTVFLADYSRGLLALDVATGEVTRLVDVADVSSRGCDGIVLDAHGALIAIQNGVTPARVIRFVIDSARRRVLSAKVLDSNPAIADEPTIGTIAADQFVYVANSQWEKYDESGTRKAGTRLAAPVLLAVPLR